MSVLHSVHIIFEVHCSSVRVCARAHSCVCVHTRMYVAAHCTCRRVSVGILQSSLVLRRSIVPQRAPFQRARVWNTSREDRRGIP